VILDIEITGNQSVSTSTVLSKIKLREGDRFSQKAVNEDIKRLYATGFFTDVTAKAEDYEGGIKLMFSVTEKSVIEKIIFEGNKAYKEEVLKKQIESKEGDVLNRRRLSEDVKKLKAFYKKKGFPLIKIDYELDVDPTANKAKVYIKIDEKARYRIKEITFEGNNAFPDKRLLKVISTRPDTLFTSGYLDEDVLEMDMRRLEEFYKDAGYIDVKATNKVEYNEEDQKISIIIYIEEGDQYFTGDIILKGNKVISEKDLRKELSMKPGAPYNPAELRNDVVKIQTLYFDKGYMSCQVMPHTTLDRDKKSINITYDITEGDVNYVNEVRITGNTKTKDIVIRRELRLYPGERFDGAKLKKSKQRLYDLGYFDEVIFDTEPTEDPDKRDLVVSVKEAKTGEFSFGGGYSSVDRLLGFVEVTQRNFDIMNFPTFTGAGQNLMLRAEIGSVRQNYVLSFTEPWIFGYPYLFGFDLFNYSRKRKSALGYGYGEKRRGGDIRLGKEFTDYDRADLMYKYETVKISDVSDDATSALKDEEGTNDISSLALTLTRNTTDSKFNPMEGYLLSVTGEDAGGIFGGDKDFYKLTGIGDIFFNYQRKLVLELKARAGWADEYDDSKSVPIYERFFAGGAETVRGYKERSIGPRDAATGDPIGGESMLIGNVEATYPIFKNFKIAAFYDVGNVWEKADDIGDGDFKSGVGTGVRVKTPIGPVKVDMGYPLDRAHPDDKKKVRFHFSMTRGF
jgi:outer membrane protein insertion porin family